MKKKLLVLLIAIIPTLMPNLASAVAIDVGDTDFCLSLTKIECEWVVDGLIGG